MIFVDNKYADAAAAEILRRLVDERCRCGECANKDVRHYTLEFAEQIAGKAREQ